MSCLERIFHPTITVFYTLKNFLYCFVIFNLWLSGVHFPRGSQCGAGRGCNTSAHQPPVPAPVMKHLPFLHLGKGRTTTWLNSCRNCWGWNSRFHLFCPLLTCLGGSSFKEEMSYFMIGQSLKSETLTEWRAPPGEMMHGPPSTLLLGSISGLGVEADFGELLLSIGLDALRGWRSAGLTCETPLLALSPASVLRRWQEAGEGRVGRLPQARSLTWGQGEPTVIQTADFYVACARDAGDRLRLGERLPPVGLPSSSISPSLLLVLVQKVAVFSSSAGKKADWKGPLLLEPNLGRSINNGDTSQTSTYLLTALSRADKPVSGNCGRSTSNDLRFLVKCLSFSPKSF